MRARQPDRVGFAERGDVRVGFEVHDSTTRHPNGPAPTALMLVPTWPIIDASPWRGQVPYLARHFPTVTFDPRGVGRTSLPSGPEGYHVTEVVADASAVLDAAGFERAVVVAISRGCRTAIRLAVAEPERVAGLVLLGPLVELPGSDVGSSLTPEGVASWKRFEEVAARVVTEPADAQERFYRKHAEFGWTQVYSEPHSTRQIEHAVERTLRNELGSYVKARAATFAETDDDEPFCRAIPCPTLIIGGDEDRLISWEATELLAEMAGAGLVRVHGAGHGLVGREPVLVNNLIRRFAEQLSPPRPARCSCSFAPRRPKRVLFVSSPIGLGHLRRDLAIAKELRLLHPDAEITWLAQHPNTVALAQAGEAIHPASRWLASEADHFDAECGEHDLHAFEAYRRMDEILLANFGVFADLVEDEHVDLVVADEAWDLDYFLHENPELKRFAFAWLTDFVGWLPTVEGGEREAFLAADYNAEMIEQVERFRRVRDRALFVGNLDDVVPGTFGTDLPAIRDWVSANFSPVGYVSTFDADRFSDRDEHRRRLGWPTDQPVCVAAVGGSAAGHHLLQAVVAAHQHAARRVDGLRTVVVCGPRIDPSRLPQPPGVELVGYTPEPAGLLAAADLAVVQGGLTTAMELTSLRRPFVYVPLRHHFEQQYHVPWRLERYGAGRRLDYETAAQPDRLADVIADQLGGDTSGYLPVEADGAARAAHQLAELL